MYYVYLRETCLYIQDNSKNVEHRGNYFTDLSDKLRVTSVTKHRMASDMSNTKSLMKIFTEYVKYIVLNQSEFKWTKLVGKRWRMKMNLFSRPLSQFVKLTCVTYKFTDHTCHIFLDPPPQPSTTVPLLSNTTCMSIWEGLVWDGVLFMVILPKGKQWKLFSLFIFTLQLNFGHTWLPMDLIGCMAPKSMWWNAMIIYNHPQLLQSPP